MPVYHDRHLRLEPSPDEWNLQESFEAAIHDPAWFLARQWQMGEHQGENASSPVLVEFQRAARPMEPLNADPALDPKIMPAEALVESEPDDWWTMGRRIRVGQRMAQQAGLGEAEARARFRAPPPPYDAFEGAFDGKALWELRADLGLAEAAFGADTPPPGAPWAWRSTRLDYRQSFPFVAGSLEVDGHHGGAMDWYSADGQGAGPEAGEFISDLKAIPTPLEYPGAPHARFWQIEDAQTDIGGYAPDTAHFATMLLVDLVYSHGDDWFLFPMTGHAGHVVAARGLVVTDAFGLRYAEADFPGLQPPDDWSLFACKGLPSNQLVLWSVAELPLEGLPLESVQFGIDEQMNWLWAVERVVDAREVEARPAPPASQAAHPLYDVQAPGGDATRARAYRYLPSQGIAQHWHPYPIEEVDGERRFIQGGLADLSREVPAPMPRPRAETLFGGQPPQRELHWLYPAVIPSNGVQVERRWMLARDRRGQPVLWIQRQRKPLYSPPARNLRFDVLEESGTG